jgi:hypothetical protein
VLVLRGLQRRHADRHPRELRHAGLLQRDDELRHQHGPDPEWTTVAEANSLVLQGRTCATRGSRKVSVELVQVDVNYYLD